ncbi:phage tail tape measure protein [Agrobacterium tumefaciens]|uniref:phage tail tape measure protein n=1 Tax=Agrobacterium tumefaciens TaxID=358 RepID=UPI001573992E|nr:hypothetical protein [Agrobacterium tumefaciens]NTD88657.1 hypothetical protein [Agrobacterium tumefaciens]NTD91386.1 hypothetical protein [Agrobacterium tumefaciens]NTD98834.1 hypothetical protein [Agrobacterium tumefaciens]NTE12214.1 hypothetical protein [Agrobacterium tumefaciens]NTE20292.1 hypothetical protein [Agrobacterium tumefaciens]
MSQTDEERLVIMLEARIKDLERNMAKASGTTEREFRKMSQSSKSATRQMEQDAIRSTTRINQAFATVGTKIGGVGKAFAGGLVGTIVGAGIVGVIGSVKQVTEAVAELGDKARMAGLSSKAFQEWKYVAEQARIPVDAITDGLKELQLRADEFAVTGKGSAAEAFQRLGLTPEEVKTKLKDPTELMLLLIERTRQLKDTAAGIRIFDELFGGTGGERMVSLIAQGEAGIRAQIKAANDFGHVLSDDVIAKAQELDRQFNAISMTVGNTLKSAVVSVVDSMMDFLETLRAVEKQRSSTITKQINDIMRQKQETAKALQDIDSADNRMSDRQKVRAKSVHEQKMRELDAEENRRIQELESRPEVMNFKPVGGSTWTPPAYKPPPASPSKSSRSAATTQAERERKAVQELIAELEEELRIVNLSDDAKRASVASRQAGAAATDDERKKIISLNEAIYQEEEARRKTDEQMLYYRDLTKAGLDDLFSAIEEGKSFWVALGDVAVNSLKRIADTMLDDVLDSIFQVNNAAKGGGGGGGFLSSLFGGLFGGGGSQWVGIKSGSITGGLFANGGAFPNGINGFSNQVVSKPTMFAFADGAGLMGEAGPEAIMPLSRDGSGRLGVAVNGSAASGAGNASGGSSEVLVKLSPELVGEILKQAQGQTLKIVSQNNKDTRNIKQNGGEF